MHDQAPTILIIDNDDGVVRALTARLESLGYDCVTAGSGMQGLAIFRDHDVDLVITDLNMPAGDGIELTKSLRAISDVPVIIVTGYRKEYASEIRSIPHVTILEKPFETTCLVELVEADLGMAGRDIPLVS